MNSAELDRKQPIGLDIGTSRIVVARSVGGRPQYEAQLNAFVTLPHSRLTESLLRQEGVFFEVQDREIVVAGDDSQRFAEILHVEVRRPMLNGVLNPREPYALAVIRSIIAKLIGKDGGETQKVVYSVPAPVTGGEASIAYHEASCRQVLTDLGYEAQPIVEGLAVVLGEMESSNFTGIGISCGSGLSNVCLAVLSLPVVSFSIPKGGDYVDSQAALATGDLAIRMRVQKEQSFELNGFSSDCVQNALTVYYDDMIRSVVEAVRGGLTASGRLPKLDRAIPLVLTGGSAMPRGFRQRFEKALRPENLPFELSEIRLAAEPLYSTARGALLASLC
jgi:actin-like ATPase involved in cell morphogenesis